MLRGTCDPTRLMDIFENFLLFDNTHGEVAKLMAKNHQYIGVNKVLENVKNIEELKRKTWSVLAYTKVENPIQWYFCVRRFIEN